jgi:hypothetical protein
MQFIFFFKSDFWKPYLYKPLFKREREMDLVLVTNMLTTLKRKGE